MSGREKSKAAARANKKTRSVRTGLQFPVGRIHGTIRHIGDLKQEVNNPGEQNPETHLTPAETASSNVLHPRAQVPWMCSTSLLIILWKNFLEQSDCTNELKKVIVQAIAQSK